MRPMPHKTGSRRARVPRTRGYTLIELALVVGVLGLLAIAITDFYLGQLNLDRAHRRVEGTVSDVQTILNASVLWKEEQFAISQWPNDGLEILSEPLVDDGFLPFIPEVRYIDCPMGCGEYELTGWDRNAHPLLPEPGDYEDDPMVTPLDLVIRFNVWGLGDARLIASQLPHGMVLPPMGDQHDNEERTIEARLTEDTASGQYLRLRNELRPVVFGRDSGSLQGVATVTHTHQADLDNPTGPGMRFEPDRTELGFLESGGSKLVFDANEPDGHIRADAGLVMEDETMTARVTIGGTGNQGSIKLEGGDVSIDGGPSLTGVNSQLETLRNEFDAHQNLPGH